MSRSKKCWVFMILSATLALIIILVQLNTLASQSNDVVSFSYGEPHTHTLDFRLYFETKNTQVGFCTINVQDKIFDESKAYSVVKTIQENTEQLLSFLELKQQALNESILYIVENSPKGIQMFDNRIYCTYNDIENGNYLDALPDENLSHPFEVRILLYEMVEAPKAILAAIEKAAPDYLEIVQNNYAVPIEYFTSAARFSHANINKRSVYLRHPCHVTHETTHILVPPLHSASAYSIQWQYEGIAEYLSQKYYSTKYIQELYYNLLTQKSANDIQNAKTPEERDFIQLVLDGHTIYLSENEMPNSASELNVREYMEA